MSRRPSGALYFYGHRGQLLVVRRIRLPAAERTNRSQCRRMVLGALTVGRVKDETLRLTEDAILRVYVSVSIGNRMPRTVGTRETWTPIHESGCLLRSLLLTNPKASHNKSNDLQPLNKKKKKQHAKMMFSKVSLIVLVAIMASASATNYDSYSAVSKARSAVRWASPIDFFLRSHFPPAPFVVVPIG
jgi:hypothetical protein